MQREKVDSSMIKSLGYDRQGKILEVEFHNGGVYKYFGVEPDHIEAMSRAKSVGTYFLKNVKGAHDARRVEENEAETAIE